jgi:hypothetical protein
MAKPTTIHTSRTLMFAELARVLEFSAQDDTYLDSLNDNVTNKLTKSNQEKTNRYLTQLYGFDLKSAAFKCFKHFWQGAGED